MAFASKSMGNGKRGQMEMLGIAVIVVFLALGIFFMVRFNLFKPASDTKKVYTQSELASNTISAIITTTSANCSNLDFLDIIIDCADFNAVGGNILCIQEPDGNQNLSCEYMAYSLDDMLSRSLDSWGKSYVFNISVLSGNLVESIYGKSNGDCGGERRSGQFFFETNIKGTMLLKLDVCS